MSAAVVATSLHRVKVQMRPARRADVVFTCAGDSSAACHRYPACGCESHSHQNRVEHPDGVHEQCWVATWFELGAFAAFYEGPDATEDGWPTEPREGPITTGYDECLLWDWAS